MKDFFIEFFIGVMSSSMGAVFLFAPSEGEDAYVFKTLGAVFCLIGLLMLGKGIAGLKREDDTMSKGRLTYGVVLRNLPSNTFVNGYPIIDVEVALVETTGAIGRYIESTGTRSERYNEGQFLRVKHFNGDINIIGISSYENVPESIRNKLARECGHIIHKDTSGMPGVADTITIDGIEYVRKDSQENND